MTTRLYIKVRNFKSAAAKAVANELSARLGYKVYRSRLDLTKKKALIYGAGVSKLVQYEYFKANTIPALEFTDLPYVAGQWLEEGNTVIARTLLNGSCGNGIVVCNPGDAFVPAPVYTKYKKKKREFRVHMFKDNVVVCLEKKLKKGCESSKIRNHKNGYVFCSLPPEHYPAGLRELAIQAASVTSSDFRGVDIGFNESLNDLFVIEVNSGPGIEGSNINRYVETILSKV